MVTGVTGACGEGASSPESRLSSTEVQVHLDEIELFGKSHVACLMDFSTCGLSTKTRLLLV